MLDREDASRGKGGKLHEKKKGDESREKPRGKGNTPKLTEKDKGDRWMYRS